MIVFHDPGPEYRNEYASKMYLASLQRWMRDNGIEFQDANPIQSVPDGAILITNGDYLTPSVIRELRTKGVRMISFDINDSSLLTDAYRLHHEIREIDLIFKIAGIQKANVYQDCIVTPQFEFRKEDRVFLPDDAWEDYHAMHSEGRLQSLPYVPWYHTDAPERSYEQRSGKVLIRGGNHIWRFLLYLQLLKAGAADERSSFVTADYFMEDMNPAFRYCDRCRKPVYPLDHTARLPECNSPAEWGAELVIDGRWNNRCPNSFIWLANQFSSMVGDLKEEGFLAMDSALNGHFHPAERFMADLAQATMYADLKWAPSIYAPPRFWEAANAGTINFLPERTNDQEYFPHIEEGEHYLTFSEDFKGFNPTVDRGTFERISGNANDLFTGWIKPGKYPISERLCRHIWTEIERAVA